METKKIKRRENWSLQPIQGVVVEDGDNSKLKTFLSSSEKTSLDAIKFFIKEEINESRKFQANRKQANCS